MVSRLTRTPNLFNTDLGKFMILKIAKKNTLKALSGLSMKEAIAFTLSIGVSGRMRKY